MTKHDDKIKQLLNKIETERKELGPKPKISWKTNCLFRFDDQRHFNLNTVKDTSVLVEALAFLLEKEAMCEKASHLLGVEFSNLEWMGFSVKDWQEDFKLKTDSLKWNLQQKKLETLEKQLKGLISEDAKTEMALSEIENLLS